MRHRRRKAGWRRLGLGMLALAAALVGVLAWKPDLALEAEYARLRWLAGAETGELDAAAHRWAYVASGPVDAPMLLLVHGLTGSKENWLPLMRELRSEFRVLAVDLPGWGDSQRIPGQDYGVAAQAARLSAFIDALERPPVLLGGHSMGGHIAGLAAAARPGQVPRLMLMSAAGVAFPPNDFARAIAAGEYPYAVRNRADLHRQLSLVFTDPPWVPWPADLALARRRAADLPFELEVVSSLHHGDDAFLLQSRLGDVQAPTLLLWCRDDRVIDVGSVDIFARGLAESRQVIIEGCGHMPLMAEPRLVADSLRWFLGPG